ncbi:hypothetical protein [Dyella jiangningensis]|uniref:hypothetical protein n=1 Tax=Dyella jiangningensis TaxID=1379159 RepID=UPI0011BFE0CE|nr:hypothetical protein [Dyella jiangningensis]
MVFFRHGILALAAILFFVALPAMADNAKQSCASDIRFEGVSSISINSLGWLAIPKSISAAEGSVVFWPFDTESQPVQAEWSALAIVLANSGDIGANSVGGIIWVKKTKISGVKIDLISRPAASVTFSFDKDNTNCREGVKFELTNSSEVKFGGRTVGKIN